MVAEGGLEHPRSDDQRILSPMCLPIPPLGHDSNIACGRGSVKHKVVKRMQRLSAFPNKQSIGDAHRSIEQFKGFRIPTHLRLKHHFECQSQRNKRGIPARAIDPNSIHNNQRDHICILLSHRFDSMGGRHSHIKYVSLCLLVSRLTYKFKLIVNHVKDYQAILFRKQVLRVITINYHRFGITMRYFHDDAVGILWILSLYVSISGGCIDSPICHPSY